MFCAVYCYLRRHRNDDTSTTHHDLGQGQMQPLQGGKLNNKQSVYLEDAALKDSARTTEEIDTLQAAKESEGNSFIIQSSALNGLQGAQLSRARCDTQACVLATGYNLYVNNEMADPGTNSATTYPHTALRTHAVHEYMCTGKSSHYQDIRAQLESTLQRLTQN